MENNHIHEVYELANRNTFTGKKVKERGARKATIFFCGSCGRIAGYTGSLKSYRCCNAANTGLPDCQYSKRKRDVLEGSYTEIT
nr:hypothetical protein [Butyrivibrio sp. WCE2006]